jgi:hypothetical protein
MAATYSPLAAAMPVRMAAKEPKLREWATSWLGKPASGSSLRSTSSDPSGDPSTTKTASSRPWKRSSSARGGR